MDISQLKKEYAKRKDEIKKRLKDFSYVMPNEYFYELCFCVLTPQSSAYKCDECIQTLKSKDFFRKEFEINKYLKTKTRFHNNKSKYLVLLKNNYRKMMDGLSLISDAKEKRDYLVKNVKGIGLKEAAHFLRNIGVRNLAILDRHILKNLVKLGVLKELPKSLTRNVYLEIEQKFLDFSKKIGIPMDELDLLFWSTEAGRVFK